MAAVWVVSEPAVPGWLDRSGACLSQLRALLAGRTLFSADHRQAAAGELLGTSAGGLRAGSACPDAPLCAIQLSLLPPHGCLAVSPVAVEFLISGVFPCVCPHDVSFM